MIDAASAASQRWDAVVVGTGVGGGTVGLQLARRGWRVLFCERGRARAPGVGEGRYAEFLADGSFKPASPAQLARAGRWSEPIDDRTGVRSTRFTPFIGCGVGGSSALYGMAMERLFPADFDPPDKRQPRWPIPYDAMAPFYAAAEALYRVRGSADPLRPDVPQLLAPPPLSAADAALAARLGANGVHPYQMPSACEYVQACESCQGYLCPRQCKNDSARVAVEPALRQHGAELLTDCEVVKVETQGRSVESLVCRHRGLLLTLRARIVILAAGALNTPLILLRSTSQAHPRGLANGSGLVGRNLMRHLIALYAIEPREADDAPGDNRRKALAFNDFYVDEDGFKLGTVQSFGRLPPAEMVAYGMHDDLARAGRSWLAALVRAASPMLRAYLRGFVDRRTVLASIVEDSAQASNRVEIAGDAAAAALIHYRTGSVEHERAARMRARMKQALAGLRYRVIDERDNNQRIAHVCGTCRFGDDPSTSVLDRECRAHELDNLYVTDSSFFPSSGGTNPSLTIAANALRVAAALTGVTANS